MSENPLTKEIVKELSKPFEPSKVSLKVQTKPNENGNALIVPYIDARDVIERLNEVAGGRLERRLPNHQRRIGVFPDRVRGDAPRHWRHRQRERNREKRVQRRTQGGRRHTRGIVPERD